MSGFSRSGSRSGPRKRHRQNEGLNDEASSWSMNMINRFQFSFVVLIVAVLSGCASLPPGSDFPRTASSAFANPEQTRLGRQFEDAARAHDGNSGFRIIPVGADGFLTRMQMINAAERSLDLQYFIFSGDETGRLLTDAVVRAADRG